MLKLIFVANDSSKLEARNAASQDNYSVIVVDFRTIVAMIAALLIVVLSITTISLKKDKKWMMLANEAAVSELEMDNQEKQDRIDSLESQLREAKLEKAEQSETIKSMEKNADSMMLGDGILDGTIYENGIDGIPFMKFAKPVELLDYKEDWVTVNHNQVLSNNENSSSAFEWYEEPKEIAGAYLLVEKEHEFAYIPLNLKVKYRVANSDFKTWGKAYLVFQKSPKYALLKVAGKGTDYGVREDGTLASREMIYIGDGAYNCIEDLEIIQYCADHEDVEIELSELTVR